MRDPMDWLICVVLGHEYMYQCDLMHPTLPNHRKCKTCGKEQYGTYISGKMVWKPHIYKEDSSNGNT